MTSRHKLLAYVQIVMLVSFGMVGLTKCSGEYPYWGQFLLGMFGVVSIYWLGQEKVVEVSL